MEITGTKVVPLIERDNFCKCYFELQASGDALEWVKFQTKISAYSIYLVEVNIFEPHFDSTQRLQVCPMPCSAADPYLVSLAST
jgi:hypothetical protein